MGQSNTSSSNATLRVLLGQSFKLHQICTRSQVFANIYGHCLDRIPNSTLVKVGASALLWSLWLCRNDCVFNGKISSPMQVIYRCTHWLRMWSTLHRTEYQLLFKAVCMRLERVAREVFTQHGWQHNLRIDPPSPST